MPDKIIQIVPAETEWKALYGEGEEAARSRILCWALVEDDAGARRIEGLVIDPSDLRRIVLASDAVDETPFLQYGYKPSK